MQNSKSYEEMMEEQARDMEKKYGEKKKKKVLIHKDSKHFDSADYEKTKQPQDQAESK